MRAILPALCAALVVALAACGVASGAGKSPRATFTVSPASSVTGQSVTFDASASTCYSAGTWSDAACTAYRWDDDADANDPLDSPVFLGNGKVYSRTFQAAGTKYVWLTVTDSSARSTQTMAPVVVAAATPTPTPSPTPTPTPTETPTPTPTPPPGGSCDRNATTSTFSAEVAAATPGQTVCLTQSANYGSFTGTNKAITITPADGISPTMTLNLGSGDADFTIDGKRETWDDTTGLHINGGSIQAGVTGVTFRDFWSTGAGRLWVFDAGPICGSNITIDHGHFYDVYSGEAIIYVDHTSGEPCNTGLTIQNSLFRHSSADGVKLSNDARVDILDNKFLDSKECLPGIGCSGNHTDAVQFYSGTGSVVRGNWVDQCDQAISGFDGQSSALIEHNLVTNCGAHWLTYMADTPASTVQWNTIGDSAGAVICGNKSGLDTPSDTIIRNNVARGIALTGGGATCTPDQNTNNLVDSGATAGNVNGIPLWVSGGAPTTFEGYCLSALSPGYFSSTVGGQVGLCGDGWDAATNGPPRGEGY